MTNCYRYWAGLHHQTHDAQSGRRLPPLLFVSASSIFFLRDFPCDDCTHLRDWVRWLRGRRMCRQESAWIRNERRFFAFFLFFTCGGQKPFKNRRHRTWEGRGTTTQLAVRKLGKQALLIKIILKDSECLISKCPRGSSPQILLHLLPSCSLSPPLASPASRSRPGTRAGHERCRRCAQ